MSVNRQVGSIKDLPSGTPAVAQLDALTGLRFFAALAVLFVHAVNLGIRRDAGYEQWAASAVSFFFVLSGFILTYVYSERLTWSKVPEYLVARWARIWPLHVVCLCCAATLFMSRGYLPWNLETLWRFVTNLLLVQSWITIVGWPFSFNGPAWSISTELGFYLAFPLLLLAGRRRFWPVLAVVTTISLGWLAWLQVRCSFDDSYWALASEIGYCNPLIRGFDFVVGMATGKWFLWQRQNEPKTAGSWGESSRASAWRWCRDTLVEVLGLGVVAAVAWAASRSGGLHAWLVERDWLLVDYWSLCGGSLVLPFALLIWVFAWSRGAFAQLLSQPLLVWLGEVSFALYLVQNVVIRLFDPWLAQFSLPASVIVGAVIATSLGLAMLLHLSVELPFRSVLRECASGQWRRAGRALVAVPGNLLSSGVLLTAVGLVIASIGVLRVEVASEKYRRQLVRNEVVEELNGEKYQRIEFDREASLLSWSSEERPNGLEFTLLWEVQPTAARGRFVHVTDSTGKIVFQPVLETDLFKNAEPGERVTDRFRIPRDKLPAEGRIGVGFYDKYLGTTPVKGEPVGMNGRRLEIYSLSAGRAESSQKLR
ncbi:MAG: acyltransferase family protein [Planctomycetota bacterium]